MRIKSIMIRIILQLVHDKRTIGLMILAPILVLALMSLVFDGSVYHPKVGIINAPIRFVDRLEDDEVKITRYSESDALEALKSSQIDAIINYKNGTPKIELEGSDPNKTQAVLKAVQEAGKGIFSTSNSDSDITYLYGYDDMADFDNLGPMFIGVFVFFFVFLIAGVSFLNERTTGTLERILATPLKRWEIIIGYLLGFGVFTIIQSALIAWFAIHILNVMMIGSFFLVLLVTTLTAMVALTIGTFISAFANNELQMIQFIPIIVVPQVFFSGVFDLSTMSPVLQYFAKLMPLWYSADGLRSVMIRGLGWDSIAFDCLILIVISMFFTVINILVLKKYRKI